MKERWNGHASSPTDSARNAEVKRVIDVDRMKVVLVGQPTFAFFLFQILLLLVYLFEGNTVVSDPAKQKKNQVLFQE